ncbi:Rdx family protein [compost metagenome]
MPGTGGIFQIHVGDELVWDRKEKKGFPEVPVLKRIVRDRVAPGLALGHTDRAGGAS